MPGSCAREDQGEYVVVTATEAQGQVVIPSFAET
jgi:hypothetical protein